MKPKLLKENWKFVILMNRPIVVAHLFRSTIDLPYSKSLKFHYLYNFKEQRFLYRSDCSTVHIESMERMN